jgi:hypothetical protein
MKNINQISSLFAQRLAEIENLVRITNKTSVLVIQQFPIESDTNTLIPNVRESISNILAFVELGDVEVLKEILKAADGIIDSIVMDADVKCSHSEQLISYAENNVVNSKLFFYSDNNTWADSAIKFLQQVSKGLFNKKILVTGVGTLNDTIIRKLKDYKPQFIQQEGTSADIIIGTSVKEQSINEDALSLVTSSTKIYDVGIGNFTSSFLDKAQQKGAQIYRIDIRAGISSTVLNILETDYLISNVMGSAVIKDVDVVAGGEMGKNGAIIIDDISRPTYVIGVADGEGNIKIELSEKEKQNLSFIERLINPTA